METLSYFRGTILWVELFLFGWLAPRGTCGRGLRPCLRVTDWLPGIHLYLRIN